MKIYKCDKCKKVKEIKYDERYPKDWFLIKVFFQPNKKMKGQHGRGYHLCKKCKEKVFGK